MPMPLLATWGTLCLGRLWRERANMLHMREAAAKVLVLVILLWIYGNTSSAIKMTHARACRQQLKGRGGRGSSCRLQRRSNSRLQLHMFTRIDWQHEHSDIFSLSSLPSPLSLATPGSYGLINPLCSSDNLQISGAGRVAVKWGVCAADR